MKKLKLFSLAVMALFTTSMWAETTETITVVSNGSSTSSAPLKDKSNSASGTTLTGCTVSIEWTANTSSSISSKYYAQLGENSTAVGEKYFKVSVNSGYKINSIKYYLSNTQSSDKDTDYGILAWDNELTPALTNPSYAATGAVFTTKKGTIKEQTETFTSLEGVQVNDVRMYRKVSGVTYGGKTNQAYGSKSVTLYIQKVDVTVEELPVCPSGLTISGAYHTYAVGEEIELTASLTAGNGTITYQWYKGGTEESNKLTGKTSSTLNIASCVDGDAGDYYCVASKAGCGSAVNATAYAITVQEAVDKYTVVYKDGDDELGTESVVVGEHPTASAITPTKELYTFAGWEYNDAAVTLSSFDGVKDQTYNFMATWNPNYLNDGTNTTIDFEEGGADLVAAVADYNIVASNAGSYDGGKASENYAYKGWKIKSNGATVKFIVPAHKYIQFKFGYLAANATVTISGDDTPKSITEGASKTEGGTPKYTLYTYKKTYEALYTFTTGSAEAAVIKAIKMSDEEPTAIEETADDAAAVKFIKDGQIFIEKNGHVYNVLGGCVK